MGEHLRSGLTEIAEMPHALVCMHLGAPVEVRCTRGDTIRKDVRCRRPRHHSRAHGLVWELKQEGWRSSCACPTSCCAPWRCSSIRDPNDIEIADRFQMRDPVIEHIGWTLKADIDSNLTGGRLLRDSLGVALAARLLQRHYRGSLPMREIRGGLTHTKLERVIAHIEDNLASKLSLAGNRRDRRMSVSHLKTLFRNSTACRVRIRAATSRRACAAAPAQPAVLDRGGSGRDGFAHQSHLARHMHRILGYTPSAVRRRAEAICAARVN
jgi:AraC family transcriptional regulator